MTPNETFREFFGAGDVSPINLYVAIYADFPEWLRGIVKDKDLPRRQRNTTTHRFLLPATVGKQAERISWIVENLHGGWNITQTWLYLETDEDAVTYKLVWE